MATNIEKEHTIVNGVFGTNGNLINFLTIRFALRNHETASLRLRRRPDDALVTCHHRRASSLRLRIEELGNNGDSGSGSLSSPEEHEVD